MLRSMLDLSYIREHPDAVSRALAQRHSDIDIAALLQRDVTRRELIGRVEALQAERNETSKRIGDLKRAGEDAGAIMDRMRQAGEDAKRLQT